MPKQLRSEKYAASLEADVDSALSALEASRVPMFVGHFGPSDIFAFLFHV